MFKPVKTKSICLAVLALLVTACVSVPSEAPELSIALGKRISAIEKSNITLLQRFFKQKRDEVDRFVEEQWLPTFANNFFSKPAISKAWNTIVKENDKQQRLIFLMKTGPKLQQMLNKKRRELIKPLELLERAIEQKIRDEYRQARSMNNSITSFLVSAAEVADNRDRYMQMAGVSEEKLTQLVDKTDAVVAELLEQGQDAQKKVASADKFIKRLQKLRDEI